MVSKITEIGILFSDSEDSNNELSYSKKDIKTKIIDKEIIDKEIIDSPGINNKISEYILNNYNKIEIGKNSNMLNNIIPNSQICYIKTNGKVILSKYFKFIDIDNNKLTIGFYIHNKRNYDQKLDDINILYAQNLDTNINNTNQSIVIGGSLNYKLKNTILIKKNEWIDIQPGTIISYQKSDGNMIYNSKFNAYTTPTEKYPIIKISLTTNIGFTYKINPTNIKKIYRHITSNDKTILQILQKIKILEDRITELEINK
jgi:hypothetical protein